MRTDTRCAAGKAPQRPEVPPHAATTGLAFGCVDWFLYDAAAPPSADDEQDGLPQLARGLHAKGMTAREEQKLMGYVR